MKIGVIVARYSVTGVPLAQSRLAAALVRAGHEVDFIVCNAQKNIVISPPLGANLILLESGSVKGAFVPICRYLFFSIPDIIFSAEDHLNTVVSVAAIVTFSSTVIAGSSRVTPFDTYSDKWFSKKWFLKKIVRATAWRQNLMTCVSRGTVEEYRVVLPEISYEVVHNIILTSETKNLVSAPLSDPWLPDKDEHKPNKVIPVVITAGSLEPWKGVDTLVRAIGILHASGFPVRLLILGEGSQRQFIEELVNSLGLNSFVRMPGIVENPYKYFSRGAVFALCSRVESFGNVLVEAMVSGLTPVAADCPTGPREVLADGEYGYLVEPGSPDSIAEGLTLALNRPIDPEVLMKGASRFTDDVILKRYSELLGIELQSISDRGEPV